MLFLLPLNIQYTPRIAAPSSHLVFFSYYFFWSSNNEQIEGNHYYHKSYIIIEYMAELNIYSKKERLTQRQN